MICINCFNLTTKTINSRPHKTAPLVWRRHKCERCDTVFTTFERPSLAEGAKILDDQGHFSSFNLGKLTISISRAFAHNKKEADFASLALAQTVEQTLATQLKELTTGDIEAVTHQILQKYDPVAAVQYGAQHQLLTSTRRRGRPSLSA